MKESLKSSLYLSLLAFVSLHCVCCQGNKEDRNNRDWNYTRDVIKMDVVNATM